MWSLGGARNHDIFILWACSGPADLLCELGQGLLQWLCSLLGRKGHTLSIPLTYLCKWSKVGTCKATQAVDLCAELGHCVLWVNLGSCSSFYSKRFAMRFKSLQVNTLGYMDVATSFPSFQPAYTCCLSDMGRIKHSSRQEIYRTKKVDGEGRIAI